MDVLCPALAAPPGQCCHLPLMTRLVVPPLKTKPGTEPLNEPSSAENSSHESTHGKCRGGLSRLRAVISTRPSNDDFSIALSRSLLSNLKISSPPNGCEM